LRDTERRVEELDSKLAERSRENKVCQRLMTVPGIGPITATALTATVGDATVFASGRHLAAWLGLVPRQTSSGGKEHLGSITKAGDGYLRRLLVHEARTVMRWHGTKAPWLAGLLKRRPFNVAVVALANKLARIAWAVMARGEDYRKPEAAAEPAQR
jgi:transposase